MDFRVVCVELLHPNDDASGIVTLGVTAGGEFDPPTFLSRQDVYDQIATGLNRFYVEFIEPTLGNLLANQARRVYLRPAIDQHGHNYVRTEADGFYDNNLLALRRCGLVAGPLMGPVLR